MDPGTIPTNETIVEGGELLWSCEHSRSLVNTESTKFPAVTSPSHIETADKLTPSGWYAVIKYRCIHMWIAHNIGRNKS